MSELLNVEKKIQNWQLLATVSTLALLTSIMGASDVAASSDVDQPTVWVQLGGQMESQTGQGDPFVPDFIRENLTAPGVQGFDSQAQKPSALTTGFEGALLFQPEGSDWVFSAAVRYGRANRSRNVHHTASSYTLHHNSLIVSRATAPTPSGYYPFIIHCCNDVSTPAGGNRYTTMISRSEQTHAVIDFQAGKDVGLGLFGSRSSSVVSAGVRFAQFTSKSNAIFHGRPDEKFAKQYYSYAGYQFSFWRPLPAKQYAVTFSGEHRFHGIGPAVSWSDTAPLLGRPDTGEIDFDWGVNAAILFGRQRASGSHQTISIYRAYGTSTQQHSANFNRNRTVAIPNLGGFAGLSFRFLNAKVSLGYRGDFFFGAIDAGTDTRETKTVGFYGPFAGVSIGLGG